MKKQFKSIMIPVGILVIIIAVFLGSLLYTTHYKTVVVDTARSVDGGYEVVLQKIGEPAFPFGSASGKLVLREGETVVSKANFKIANDGGPINKQDWSVIWYDDHVEILLSGEEQYDELVTMYYDGQVERCRLTTKGGMGKAGSDAQEAMTAAEAVTDAENDLDYELFEDEQQINDGYQAIYELLSGSTSDHFAVSYGARDSSSRCILSEDSNTIEYLVYNGRSENEKCGLYVYYQSEKDADGTWSYADGTVVDIYAYVYESGDIVSSGKTSWEDIGSEAYQQATGEK